jgi:polyribonucleotide nucleotidyltransferase
LKIEVNPDYHPKIIGRRGAVVMKIRQDHDVQINLLKKGEPNDNIITITGYEESCHKARDDIMKIVSELNEMVKEEIEIDARVHSRLIGAKGRNIRKIMDDFKVDIKFPRAEDDNPNLVIISGADEHVLDCKDHLLNLEEEYIQDVTEAEMYRPMFTRTDDTGSQKSETKEFVVKGAPWEQQAPNMTSVKEFPTFGKQAEPQPEYQSSPITGAWGHRH